MTRHHREGPRQRKTFPVDEPVADTDGQYSNRVANGVSRRSPTAASTQPPSRHAPPLRRRRHLKDEPRDERASLWGCVVLGLVLFVFGVCSVYGMKIYMEYLERIKVNNPLLVSRLVRSNESHPYFVAPDRYWGSYRPHVYFGMRTRSPDSILTGLMWLDQLAAFKGGSLPLRHWCEHGDGLRRYGWNAHDGKTFGSQEIVDHRFTLSTQFVKRPTKGVHGGDWTARVTATPNSDRESVVISLMFYVMLPEGVSPGDYGADRAGGAELRGVVGADERLEEIVGSTPDNGPFSIGFLAGEGSVLKHNHLSAFAPSAEARVVDEVVLRSLVDRKLDPRNDFRYLALGGRQRDPNGTPHNLVVHQVTVSLPFTLEIVYMSEDAPLPHGVPPLRDQMFEDWISWSLKDFEKTFETKFSLREKGFSNREIKMAQSAFSNLLGSVGYFYGSSIVQSPLTEVPVNYWNAPLYTGVPSRSFFPRGFLWDEGFHNLLISEWDLEISKDILGHWFDLINREGWIPREQILGAEARSKVPAEFVVQHNDNANPPAFFLPLKKMVPSLLASGQSEDVEWLETLYPRLQAWYAWYNKTQRGDDAVGRAFRWRGRNPQASRELNPKTLTSGLDDYPRASHPTSKERHVDLLCWMALAASVMADISAAVGTPREADRYRADHRALTDNEMLNRLHWSPELEFYADFGLHTEDVVLKRPPPPVNRRPGMPVVNSEKVRVTKSEPKYKFVDAHGYVSLFPFLLRVLKPDSDKLGKILNDLTDPQILWTSHGLRSLSRKAKMYNRYNTENDAPYWRGSIWININYLAISALDYYRSVKGPHAKLAGEIYTKLRKNVIDNIVSEYHRTGYIWEHYNDVTGYGEGTHPFTGWSALVVLIMGEKYH